jgi:transposase-like protein
LRCPKCDKEFGLRYGSKIYPLEEAVEDIKKGVI